MDDDEFNRELARRRRANESRAPQRRSGRSRRGPWLAVVAAAVLAIVAAGMLVLVLVLTDGFPSPGSGIGSASPSASPSATPVPGASTSASPSASASASPVPTQATPGLTELLAVDDGDAMSFFSDIQPLHDGRFIAATTTFTAEELLPGGGIELHGSVYIGGPDGDWQLVDTGGTFDQVLIYQLFTPPGDLLVMYGFRFQLESAGPIVFTSPDGVTWTEPGITPADGTVAAGGPGYVMVRTRGSGLGTAVEMYHSDNARDWVRVASSAGEEVSYTHDAVAGGAEGFVITARRGSGDGLRTITIASANGVNWTESPEQPALAGSLGLFHLTAFGDGWLAAGFDAPEAGVPIFFSADGLVWEEVARVQDPANREGVGRASHLLGLGGRVFLSIAYESDGSIATRPAGVWHSEDGRTWHMLDLGDEAEVSGVVGTQGGVLMAGKVGHDRGNAVIWAAEEAWFPR